MIRNLLIGNESGRFSLESTLIFPLLFIITISCLFITIGAARHVETTIDATTAAGRAAFSWTNSSKNPMTGAYYPGLYDELYWRLSSDWSGSPLATKKLSNALMFIPERVVERGRFNNHLLQRNIHVDTNVPFQVPAFMTRLYGSRELLGFGHSTVSEPVELIRHVELARTYWPMIKKSYSNEEADAAVEVFRKRPGKADQALVFNTHDEARAYLQQLVHGQLDKRNTEDVGKWRMIDALDGNGIAHQAYYGYMKWDSNTRDQLLKDAEIASKSLVNGVVWHFFKRERDQTIGLSDRLKSELEARGIVIVIHD